MKCNARGVRGNERTSVRYVFGGTTKTEHEVKKKETREVKRRIGAR